MIRTVKLVWVLAALLILTTGQAQAALMFFTDRTSFDTAAGNLSGFESFETVSATLGPIDFGDFTVEETGDSLNLLFQDFLPTDGTRTLAYNTQTPTSLLTYSFDSQISAFGFDVSAFNTSGPQTVTIGGDVSGTINITGPNANTFFGVIDTTGTFDTVTLSTSFSGGSTGLRMDAVSYGTVSGSETVVPEPTSLTLLGIGAAGMAYGVIRRRRKQAA